MAEYFVFFFGIVTRALFYFVLKTDLEKENMLLRRELQILKRKKKTVILTKWDRYFFLGIHQASRKLLNKILIIQPETIVAWFRNLKKHHDVPGPGGRGRPRLNDEIRRLIVEMKRKNNRWGAKKIAGELKKLGMLVCKKTVSKVLRENGFSVPPANYDSWMNFMRSQGKRIFACDFIKVSTLFSKTLYVFFVIDIDTRAIVQFGVHWMPNKEWLKNLFRSLFMFEAAPDFLISDNDCVYGEWFSRFLLGNYGIKQMTIPYRQPQFNGTAERFVRTLREELLDRVIVYDENDLHRLLDEYIQYYNKRRAHSAINFDAPKTEFTKRISKNNVPDVRAVSLLSGLITDFEEAA